VTTPDHRAPSRWSATGKYVDLIRPILRCDPEPGVRVCESRAIRRPRRRGSCIDEIGDLRRVRGRWVDREERRARRAALAESARAVDADERDPSVVGKRWQRGRGHLNGVVRARPFEEGDRPADAGERDDARRHPGDETRAHIALMRAPLDILETTWWLEIDGCALEESLGLPIHRS
jgi:hypothetical protein